jgi:CRISPR-associated endonuclease/helicase Cas3
MPRISEESKQRNKEQVLMVIRRHRGLREGEIADLLSLERRTVNNYLNELEHEGKVYKEGLLWFANEHAGTWLRRFELAADEAFTLYLAARQFVKQTDKQNPMALSALSRLAEVLKTDLPVSDQIFSAAQELRRRKKETDYESVFANVVKAYLLRHPLQLTYRTAQDQTVQTVFKTYLIEPSAIGFTLYLIGHSSHVDDLRSYKIERIVTAVPDYDHTYTIPTEFPGLDILQNAWSIMIGETTERVVLRFRDEKVKRRVLETNWHPSQDYEVEEDGALRWWVDVADTTDMKPWIRGWGSQVEVLKPDHLRQHLVHTTRQLSEMYNLQPPMQRRPYQWLYAKTDRDNRDQIHLLLYHLIDVGVVAHAMWQTVFTASFRQQIADLLGLTVAEAGRFVAFITALHDLGKASPAYQNKYAPPWLRDKYKEIGLLVEPQHYNPSTQQCPHATVTTWALPTLLVEYEGYDESFARKISVALGGHHGSWPGPYAIEGINDRKCPLWDEIRHDLYWELRAVFPPPQIQAELSPYRLNTLLALLSGLTSVADWVGSNADYLPLEGEVIGTREYAAKTAVSAQNALKKLGWLGWQPTSNVRDFSQVYAYLEFEKPHTVQQEIIDAALDAPAPTLLIIEAPTGIGKTEIAQYLTDVWLQKHNGRGFYIAMPTQATSNQMYGRTTQFLAHNYPNDLLNIPLAHGNALFDPAQAAIQLNQVGDDEETGVVAMSWFAQKSKQTLLAPFGVGTVDQTLLSVLQTRHFFVRLLGLSHKVIIFDEVHAYDTYMSTLFERLLRWLKAIGTSVIMLSATLPTATRQKFVKAYTGQDLLSDLQNPTPYPALTIAHDQQRPQTIPLTKPDDITLQLNWLNDNCPQTILEFLQTELVDGGCAAVICNTVKRAQTIFALLDEARQQGILDIKEENLILFHARFPFAWRKPKEDDVLAKFGKPDKEKGDKRPLPREKAIVVATQVIEQSLDLDFDVMVTDLAPIDLILQRAGRLHRHKLRDANRQHLRRLTITPPDFTDGLPNFGVDELIYERYLLLQTYRQLHERQELTIPKETAHLIEAVYMDVLQNDDQVWQNALQTAHQQMKLDQRVQGNKAKRPLIMPPDDYRLLTQTILGLEEDNPAVHETFQAKTRDIAPSVTLVCLFQAENGVRLDPDDDTPPFDHQAPLTPDRARELWQNSITVQNWTLINHFSLQEETVPVTWRKHPVLRYTRPVILVDGVYRFTHNEKSYELRLSRLLGLQLINLSAQKEVA